MTPNLPGRWLLAIGRMLFDRAVYDAAVVPSIADLQADWLAASTSRERMIARWRGLVAFVALVIVSPVAFRAWPGRERGDGAPVVTLGLMMVAGLVLWYWWMPLSQPLVAAIDSVQHRLLAGLTWAAVLVGPTAAGAWLLFRNHWPKETSDASPVLALLVLLSIAMPVGLGTAATMAVFAGIGERGSAGVAIVLEGARAASMPVFFALIVSLLPLAAVARTTFDRPSNLERPVLGAVSSGAVIAFSAAALAGIHLLLELKHRVAVTLNLLLMPPQLRPAGVNNMQIIGDSEQMMHLLMAAAVSTVVILVFAISTWRALRDRRQPLWLVRVSRALAVVALAGAAWHTAIAYSDMRALANLETTLNQWGPSHSPARR